MIYITGDTHGELVRFSNQYIPDIESFTDKDYIIVCGDFGFIYHDDLEEKKILDYLETRPFNILFCDGNHENFDALYKYPKELWNGGYVHRIRKNVLHLMRGQVFDIDGKKVFSMGGALSIDRYMRTLGRSYWKQEIPEKAEYQQARENLEKVNNTVDVIVTHTAPLEITKLLGGHEDPHEKDLLWFLKWVMENVNYEKWFFGHWHLDKTVTYKMFAVSEKIHKI